MPTHSQQWAARFEAKRAMRWARLVPQLPTDSPADSEPPEAMAAEQLRKLRRLPYSGTTEDAERTNKKNIAKAQRFPLKNVPVGHFDLPKLARDGAG